MKQNKITYYRNSVDNFKKITVFPLSDSKCIPSIAKAWKKDNPIMVDKHLEKKWLHIFHTNTI